MQRHELFRELRGVLTSLYDDEASARRVAGDAGLDRRMIDFSSRPIDNWHAILEEAEKSGRVLRVLEIARAEYPNNHPLQQAHAAYTEWMAGSDSPGEQARRPGPPASRGAITGAQLKELHNALMSAFPTVGALRQMVSFELDERLEAIAGGDHLLEVVFNLITWARSQGRMDDLLAGARRANPGNAELRAIVDRLQAGAEGE